jgi:PAP2 superfamily
MRGSPRRSWALRMAARLWWTPAVVVGALADRGSRQRWLTTPGIVVLAASASTVGKLVIRRPRPDASMRVAPSGRLGLAGFPSTHATCAFAIASWHRSSRQRRWLHLIAIGIGYLRVHRRAHHCGDVVAGAILGYGISWQIESVWSRLVPPGRAARPVERASLHRGVRSHWPRTVDAAASIHRSPRYGGRTPTLADHHEVWLPSGGKRNGAASSHKRSGAKVSALEVR